MIKFLIYKKEKHSTSIANNKLGKILFSLVTKNENSKENQIFKGVGEHLYIIMVIHTKEKQTAKIKRIISFLHSIFYNKEITKYYILE